MSIAAKNSSLRLEEIVQTDARFSSKGTYLLEMNNLSENLDIKIGNAGILKLERGFYYYIGSAYGPGNLRARLARHLRKEKKKHWHIDYLLRYLEITNIWISCGNRENEHVWSKTLTKESTIIAPMQGFGSSDCQCKTHLFFSRRKIYDQKIDALLM